MLIGLENQFVVFLRVAVLHRFYCIPVIALKFNFRYTIKFDIKKKIEAKFVLSHLLIYDHMSYNTCTCKWLLVQNIGQPQPMIMVSLLICPNRCTNSSQGVEDRVLGVWDLIYCACGDPGFFFTGGGGGGGEGPENGLYNIFFFF